MKLQRHFTCSPWEPKVGYCRAVRAGNLVFVSGTAPVAKGGGIEAPGNPYRQARRCFEIALEAMQALGAGPEHVVRTRMYVADASRWEEFGRAHAEAFGAHPPASTMIEVKGFVDPAMMIEVEADAVAPPRGGPRPASRARRRR
jgi:enamine deaminase RidA (YjgF/YER057c/UK114 family)